MLWHDDLSAMVGNNVTIHDDHVTNSVYRILRDFCCYNFVLLNLYCNFIIFKGLNFWGQFHYVHVYHVPHGILVSCYSRLRIFGSETDSLKLLTRPYSLGWSISIANQAQSLNATQRNRVWFTRLFLLFCFFERFVKYLDSAIIYTMWPLCKTHKFLKVHHPQNK